MKTTVRYRQNLLDSIRVGGRAIVVPIDHPNCSNKGPVLTSIVEHYDPITGEFETENSRYVPCREV